MSYLKKLNTQAEYDAFKASDSFILPNVSLIVDGKIVMYNKKVGIPNNLIMYTSSDNAVVTPYNNNFGGANIISNTYENGVGIITFDADVTSIGKLAFYCCYGLTSVVIPNSVTTISADAFYNCSGLTSITIPNSVTSIGGNPFSCCAGLTSIIVDKNNSIYDSRDNCNAIIETETNTLIRGCKNTIIPNSVTIIGERAFDQYKSLTSITIPNSVTSIGKYAFANCSELTSIEIGNSVTSIEKGAFAYCGFTSVVIPDSVISIGEKSFEECEGLTSIEIGNSVTNIGKNAFYGCLGLTSVVIPDSVTSIGDLAFFNCVKITSITLNSTNPPSLGSSAFATYANFIIYVPDESVDAYKSATNWKTYANKIKPMSEKPA